MLSSQTCLASFTQRSLVPVSTVSARNAWHNEPSFVGVLNTTENALQIMSLAAYANGTNNHSKLYFYNNNNNNGIYIALIQCKNV